MDLGDVLLVPGELSRTERIEIAKANNRIVEVKELIGKPMPQWSVTDARGIDPKGGVQQFQGRWTLVYFWHMHCQPCAGKEVPRLTKFLSDQNPLPDNIAMVSFIISAKSWKTINDADKFLEPIARRYWTEPWTRLPQAFDSTEQTRENIAEELFGQWILIDPKGIVVATGDDTSVGLDTLKKRSGL